MAKHERDVTKEGHWREVLARQAGSGLNVRAFCRREELAESAFHFWRRTIRQRDGETQPASAALKFVPAVIESDVTGEASFTLTLAGGQVLRMPAATSIDQLVDLLVALEARRPR